MATNGDVRGPYPYRPGRTSASAATGPPAIPANPGRCGQALAPATTATRTADARTAAATTAPGARLVQRHTPTASAGRTLNRRPQARAITLWRRARPRSSAPPRVPTLSHFGGRQRRVPLQRQEPATGLGDGRGRRASRRPHRRRITAGSSSPTRNAACPDGRSRRHGERRRSGDRRVPPTARLRRWCAKLAKRAERHAEAQKRGSGGTRPEVGKGGYWPVRRLRRAWRHGAIAGRRPTAARVRTCGHGLPGRTRDLGRRPGSHGPLAGRAQLRGVETPVVFLALLPTTRTVAVVSSSPIAIPINGRPGSAWPTARPRSMGEGRGTLTGRRRYRYGKGGVPCRGGRGTERGTAGTEAGKWGYWARFSP